MTAAVRFVVGAVLAVLLSALFPVEVHAQKVALLHADMASRAEDVRSKLNAAGVTDITIFDVATGPVPMLSDLQEFQAVFTWSIAGYLNSTELGNTLADYVDEGGGVVQAAFSFDFSSQGLGGRWNTEAYSVFSPATTSVVEPLTFSLVQPSHPIVNGAFDPGWMNFYSPSFLQGDSELIASWDVGAPLVATRPGPHGGKIAGLNLYPFLGNAGPWMANALRFVASEAAEPVDGPAVALLAAGGSSAGATDVRRKLRSLRLFSRVDVFDVSSAVVPTLDTLMRYDAVLTWSSSPYGNPAGLGDALADYVDQNRGVVEAPFSNASTAGLHLEGRWSSGGYRPLTLGGISPEPSSPLTLVPDEPGHPMLSGVASFNGGTGSVHIMSVLDAATTQVASWSNGQPLAAFGTKSSGGRVVALNMYPPSSDAAADLWDRNTDGARLIANALLVATNHFPTVDALSDQSIEATSPAAVSFTLDATASDLDGDTLSYSWSGAVTASGPSIVVDVPPPPAPQKSHTVTLELAVADGKGGVTTDAVNLTVTDMTAPQLHGVPADITVEATSASGATVPYGPVTAVDLVDGAVSVVCSHSGEFPVGDTLVTCSASDTRQNEASASFTVRVTPAPEPEPEPGAGGPGRMYGRGFVNANHRHYEFGLFASENRAGAERGRLVLTVKSGYRTSNGYRRQTDHFISTGVASVTFGGDCSVVVAGIGRWNGHDGYRFEAAAADTHSRRRSHDVVRITITSPSGEVVAHVDGRLSGGNVHIFHNGY